MIEVAPSLFVGSAADLSQVLDAKGNVLDGWYVISAARDPWHRQALGYTGRGAPKEHAEYLWAHRDMRLILNLVDAADPAYIRDEIIDVALLNIAVHLEAGKKVLIHCNEGKSRAPTIAMLWMARAASVRSMGLGAHVPPEQVVAEFKAIYPDYAPAEGMRLYAQHRLEKMLQGA